MLAVVTRPLGAKVTCTLPAPVGPPGFLQPPACAAAVLSAEIAEALLKAASVVGAAAAGSSFFSFSLTGPAGPPFLAGSALAVVSAAFSSGFGHHGQGGPR